MKNIKAIILAFLAAVFYAVNVPISKILLKNIEPTMMAALLYLGAGIGIGIAALLGRKASGQSERLSQKDLPFVIGMIVLDIAAPIFLMLGIKYGSSANASLLGNFEIVATTVVALFIFHEAVSKRLWAAIGFISLSSVILSFEGIESLNFSYGSLFVLTAAVCWGFENNCTRNIASKSTYEIVILKGIFSGLGSFSIAMLKRERIPGVNYIAAALLLGFIAYGLSIFLYIRAQNIIDNKCILCGGAVRRSIFFLRVLAGEPFRNVFGGVGNHADRYRVCGCRYVDSESCTSASSFFFTYARWSDTYTYGFACS